MRTHPPRLATLLLRRLAPPNDPLAGDLAEEYAAGRSAAWYWRQVMFAVAGGWARNFDFHEMFNAQGAVMRFVMLGLLGFCVVTTGQVLHNVIVEYGFTRTMLFILDSGAWEAGRLALSFCAALAAGWCIAQFHARHRTMAVLAFSGSVMSWTLVNLFVVATQTGADPILSHLLATVVFLSGLLVGGIHLAGEAGWRQPYGA